MSRRGGYLGGHSVWYSDTARAQNYRYGSGMNFGHGSGYGGVPNIQPKDLPKPTAAKPKS